MAAQPSTYDSTGFTVVGAGATPAMPTTDEASPSTGNYDTTGFQVVDVPPSVMLHEDTGKAISMPAGVNGDEAQYMAKTQVQGLPKQDFWGTTYLNSNAMGSARDFIGFAARAAFNPTTMLINAAATPQAEDFGKQALRGAAAFTVQTLPQATGALLQETGERGVEGASGANTASGAVAPGVADMFLPISTDPDSMVNEAKRAAFQRVANVGQRLVQQSNDIVKNLGLERPDNAPEGQGLAYDFGSGLASTGYAIGMTMLTRNPLWASALFGAIQKGQIYLEGRQKGMAPEEVGQLSTDMGIANGAIEAMGDGLFMKIGEASTPIARFIQRSIEEGTQEAGQQAVEEVQAKAGGLRDTTLEQGLKNVAYAGLIGALSGAPVAAVVEMSQNEGAKHGVSPDQSAAIATHVYQNAAEGADLVANEMEKGLSKIAIDPADQKAAGEVIKKYMSGQPVDDSVQEYVSNQRMNAAMPREQEATEIARGGNFEPLEMEPRDTSRVDALRQQTAGPIDVQPQILAGRLRLLDNQVNAMDAQIDQLMATMDEREKAGKPNAANTNRLNGLLAQRQTLDDQRADILTRSNVEPDMVQQVMDQAMGRQQVQVRGDTLSRLANRAVSERSRALEAGLREGRRMALTDVAAAQSHIVDALDASDLTAADKAKFITTVKNIRTREQAEKQLPVIQSRIGRLVEMQAQREAKAAIKKLLSKTKVRKQSGKPVGKFTPDLQEMFDEMRGFAKMKAGDAATLLDERLAGYDKPESLGPTPEDALKNAVLSVMSNAHEVNSGHMGDTLDNLQQLMAEGRSDALARLLERQEHIAKIKVNAYQALTGDGINRFSEFQDRLRMQLVRTGMDPEEAAINAEATRAAYQSFSKRAGTSMALQEAVDDAFEKLVVQGGRGPEGDVNTLYQQQMDDVLSQARADKTTHLQVDLGDVSTPVKDALTQAGVDVEGYHHSMDTSAVRHMLNRHGDEKAEAARGQLPVTEEDIRAIPQILAIPDRVITNFETRQHKPGIMYVRALPDGSTLYIEEVRTGRKTLAATTMRKYPATTSVDAILASLRHNVRNDGGDLIVTDVNKNTTLAQGGVLFQRAADTDAMGFYRKAARVADAKLPNTGTPAQMQQALEAYARNGDFKQEELDYSGVKEWLSTQTGKVNKADVAAFLRDGGVKLEEVVNTDPDTVLTPEERQELNRLNTYLAQSNDSNEAYWARREELNNKLMNVGADKRKFQKFTLPGGENYREVLMTLPAPELTEAQARKVLNAKPDARLSAADMEYARRKNVNEYQSSHFDEPNILAHFRLDDRTDAAGNKVLFIEEIQSDWHQEGRKRGYVDEDARAAQKELEDLRAIPVDQRTQEQAARGQQLISLGTENRVPDAPFKKTWQDLALKRILSMAVDGGYDKIAWTTGEQQAERYDLSKQLNRVLVRKFEKENGEQYFKVSAADTNGREVIADRRAENINELSDIIGKELTQKVVDSPDQAVDMKGLDLKVGGEGMKGFYDNILPKAVDKIVKRWGGKTGKIELGTAASRIAQGMSPAEREEYFADVRARGVDTGNGEVHSLDLTPAIKAGVSEGLELFQNNMGLARGSITLPQGDAGAIIRLFDTANKSTFLHETGHFYWNLLDQLAAHPEATADLKADSAAVRNLVGAADGQPLTVDQHERVAEDFEKYLEDGKAPTPALKRAFEHFKQWLGQIYASIKGRTTTIDPAMRKVFDKWFDGVEPLPNVYDRNLIDRTSLVARAKAHGRNVRGEAYGAFNSWQDTMNLIFGADKTGVGDQLLQTLGMDVNRLFQQRKGVVRHATEFFTEGGMRALKTPARNKLMAALGFTREGKFMSQLAADSKKVDLGTFHNSAGKPVRLQLSKAEARKRWMELQDPTLVDTITHPMGNAYSPSMLDALDSFLTPEDKAFVRMQLDFYRWFYPQINDVYSRSYGVNLPNNPMYSPIAREHHDVNNPMFTQDVAYRRSVAPGSLKSRVASISALKDMNDFMVLQKHIAEMAHFMTFADKVQELGAVFGDHRITNVIDDKFGTAITRNIKDYMQDFRAGQIKKLNESIDLMEGMRQNFTVAVLGAKPALAIKNFTQFLAYAEGIPVKDFTIGLADFAAHPREVAKILGQSELLKARRKTLDRDIALAYQSSEFGRWRAKQTLNNMMLWFTQTGDIASIISGGWPVYRYHRKVLGKSHAEALQAFEDATSLTHATGDLDQLSRLQSSPSILARSVTMLMADTNQLYRREMRAVLDGVRGKISPAQAAKRIALYHFAIPMLYQFVADFFEWDPDNQLRAALWGSLNGAFIVYDIVDGLIRKLQGLHTFERTNPAVQWSSDMSQGFAKMAKNGFDPGDDEVIEGLWKVLQGGGELTGVPIGRIPQVMRAVEDFQYGDDRAGIVRVLGFPDSVANRVIQNSLD